MDLIALCERHDWTCHLCGLPIPRDWEDGAPNAPSRDHVLPQARGGANAKNLLPAHKFCNSRRGDRELSSLNQRVNLRRGFGYAMAEWDYGNDPALVSREQLRRLVRPYRR